MTIIETILSICGLITLVAGFIFWHTNAIKKVEEKFESKVSDLTDRHQLLKDEMKDLKHRDDM